MTEPQMTEPLTPSIPSSQLQRFRQALNLSVPQLAELLGLEPKFVAIYEQRDYPLPTTVQKLLMYLMQGVNLADAEDLRGSENLHTTAPHAYYWCYPDHAPDSSDSTPIPMIYHAHHPRFCAHVVPDSRIGEFALINSDEHEPNFQFLAQGKRWHVLFHFIDQPVNDCGNYASTAVCMAIKMIHKAS